jgi:hypothetical protein
MASFGALRCNRRHGALPEEVSCAHIDIENVSTHHEVALFKWVLVLQDGKVTVRGHDCILFSPAGKIVSLLKFGPASPKS